MAVEELREPPGPPEAPRRIRLYRSQWIGLALLTVLPVLAVAGVLGERWRVARARGADVEVAVRYPDRFRYRQLNQIEIRVRNLTATLLDTVRVELDTAFASRFSTVRGIPAFERPFSLAVTRMAPGEFRLVLIEIQGRRYGRHSGMLTVSARDTLRVPLSIIVFP